MNEKLRHLDYLGLKYNPFPVAPDYENFYLSEHIDQIISEIVHGVVTRKGFMILTGEVGLGKTTISRKIINVLEEKGIETSLVLHTFYRDVELLREINRDFGLHNDSLQLSDQMKILSDFLLRENRNGKNCAIIIDDAQNLNYRNLELIRMISNLETDRDKLVQILLIGQPELVDKLSSPKLRQLKSRIIIKEETLPLNQEELRNYILFKLNMAGNKGEITLARGSLQKIYKYSQGNFRIINILMDRCLYVTFLYNTAKIDKSIVDAAIGDLNQVKGTRKKRTVGLYIIIILGFLTVGGALYLDLIPEVGRLLGTSNHRSVTRNQDIHKEMISTKVRKKIHQPRETTVLPEKTPIPAVLSDFLAYYNLSDYESGFFKAMETNRFKDITDSIYENTGYQLIQLDYLPADIRTRYAAFSLTSKERGKENYFLFWKPAISVEKFYIGYKGKEIRKLEELLATVKLYKYSLDGIVGPRLMKALNRFQKDKGLPVTGFPDQRTIFLLFNN